KQSPARGRPESLPVAGIFEISEHQPYFRVLQHVLQVIGKTQHTLVAGGDPVTKRQAALFCRAENIRTQGAALADEGCRPGLRKTSVETDAESGRDFLWEIDKPGAIGATDGNLLRRCDTLQFILQARSLAANFGESGADNGGRLHPFKAPFFQIWRGGRKGQGKKPPGHPRGGFAELCETPHTAELLILRP